MIKGCFLKGDFNMFNDDFFTIALDPFNWDKESYKFNREEKDMHPYSVVSLPEKIIIVHNVLGIDKKDLKITRKIEKNKVYLVIEGHTKDTFTGKEYSISSTLQIDETQLNIEDISCNMKNGLVYIVIPKKQIKRLDNSTTIKITQLD